MQDKAEIKLDKYRKLTISEDLTTFEIHDRAPNRVKANYKFTLDYRFYKSFYYNPSRYER